MTEYMAPQAIAVLLGVDPSTVRRWCRDGRLPAIQIGGAGGA